MNLARPKQSQNSFYHRISLPKYSTQLNNKSISTRCISVNRNDHKTQNIVNPILSKPVPPPKQLTVSPIDIKYYLGKGNNEGLIRSVMNTRTTWVEGEDSTSAFINMKWQQDQKGFKYERLFDTGMYRSVVNQFECHDVLSNKEHLYRNLQHYCLKNNIDLWKIVPPTYILNLRDQCNMMLLKQFTDSYQKYYPKRLKEKGSQSDAQIQNYKTKLKRVFVNSNLKKILPKAPPIKSQFLDEDGQYLWIVKPTFLNRGRGIQVFSKLQALFKFVSDNICGYVQKSLAPKTEEDSPQHRIDYIKRNSQHIQQSILLRDPANRQIRQKKDEVIFDGNQYIRVIPKGPSVIKTDRFLIQKYLEKPMLIKNRKFDIRIWVLVSSSLKGYVCRQGYVRLSSLQYQCTDSPTKNNFMHLTNNSVQKFSQGYGAIGDNNQLSFNELKEQMQKIGLDYQQCIQRLYEHIRVTLKATLKLLNPMNRKYSFEMFGYDFMIDQTGYPWLIEVNNNPCIDTTSKLLQKLLPRALNDAFKLTVDPLFYGSFPLNQFKLEGYADGTNIWMNLNVDPK